MEKVPTKENKSESDSGFLKNESINTNIEVTLPEKYSYCYGCEMLEKGIGGENQMSHFGGCLSEY